MNRIFIFVAASQNIGGADFSMSAVIRMLNEKNIKSVVIIPKEGKIKKFWDDQNVENICIPFKRWIVSNKRKKFRHIMYTAKSIYHKYLVKKFKKQILMKCTGAEVACVYNNGFTNNFAIKLSKELKVPYIQHIREFGDRDFGWNFDLGKKKQFEKIQKDSNLIIAISKTVKDSFADAKGYEKINVVYNGVKSNTHIERKQHDSKIKIIISGRLVKEKGHIEVLRAIDQLLKNGIDNFVLDIYGEGVEEANLRKYINENHLENHVYLKGFVIGIQYDMYDIGIMSSKAEAFGRVTAEYMMNGLVTIATNSGANPELIENGKDGLLYGNFEELVELLHKAIVDESFRKKISQNAVVTAKSKYAEEIYLNNVYDLLVENKII